MKNTVKAGTKLDSVVCETQIMALRVPEEDLDICCGGSPMVTGGAKQGEPAAGFDTGTLAGKRYVDEAETMEFLCTRGGAGSLTVNGVPLGQKQAKKLPSSD
ncbi:hypothetical protein RM533_03240 [Croceicoccus sp. F390]|uniref:Uncharacterized protein n=1 Tax=Croceicoccus esteveae TaxID=3075597 RepID=A0ABU2ZF14_9SPHN|nr:hypothetical protein [Croceicoccus sp. F390]MDT0575198.1 hypothetical protein [Croceicoccus sp. F390]